MLNDVTIIVPTRNEVQNIVPFLRSLPPTIKLIVVDASDDHTPDLILQERPHNTRVVQRPSNVTEARQIGAELARTPWLLFTDADVLFADDYFEKLTGWEETATSTLLSTSVSAIYGPKLSQDEFQTYYRRFSQGMAISHRLGIPAASGSNLLIKRTAFWAIGGFDLRLTCNEDSEIAWRLKQYGHQLAFADELVVYARDHRRLYQGTTRKTLHSVARCALLFSGLMPQRWRTDDWGYWRQPDERRLRFRKG